MKVSPSPGRQASESGDAGPPRSGRQTLLLLTKYGRRAASTRFRFLQYLPALERAGFECEVSPLFDDAYLEARLDHGRVAPWPVAAGFTRRLLQLLRLRRFDGVVLYLEAFPFLPPFFERLMGMLRVPYACDLDDAWFHMYDLSDRPWIRKLLGGKAAVVLGAAAVVTAGNEYLAAYARRFNSAVTVIPTVVDTGRFRPSPRSSVGGEVVVGWIGSPSTARYLRDLKDVWHRAIRPGHARLEVVGSGAIDLGPVPLTLRAWNEAEEISAIQGFDIGIMPLSDDPWARGKCGFKLIEYMACGLPVVASPVGVNAAIVEHGSTGFLCRTPSEWIEALERLIHDAALRTALGAKGRLAAERHWSLARWAPAQVAQMQRLVGSRPAV